MSRTTQDTTGPPLHSHTGLSPSLMGLSRPFCSASEYRSVVLQPRGCVTSTHTRFGLFPGRSPLLGESLLFSLPGGTKMFQFPPFASLLKVRIITLQVIGLSHSEIPGSRVICTYPGLIAAYHVLHRLREPRHPPCALSFFLLPAAMTSCADMRTSDRAAHTFGCIGCGSFYLQSCLCQYVKDRCRFRSRGPDVRTVNDGLVENNGFEPLTPCLQSRCSSQLS